MIDVEFPSEASELMVSSISDKENAATLARGAAITLIGRVTGRAIDLLNLVIIARLLGLEQFGLFSLGWALVQLLRIISPAGLHMAVIHFGAQYWDSKDRRFIGVLRGAIYSALAIGAMLALSLHLFSPIISRVLYDDIRLISVFRGFAIIIALLPSLRVAAAATRISQRMQFAVLSEDSFPPFLLLIMILILAGLGDLEIAKVIAAAAGAFALGLGMALVFLWKVCSQRFLESDYAGFPLPRLIKYAIQVALAGIFTETMVRSIPLLVGYFLTVSHVGIFHAASQPAMITSVILNAFNSILSPMAATLHNGRRYLQMNRLYKLSTRWGLYLSLPIFLILIISPEEVMILLFGEAFGEGAIPLRILALAQINNTGTGAVGVILIMTGNQRDWGKMAILSFVVGLLSARFLIPGFGLKGAGIASFLGVATLYIGGLMVVRSRVGLWPYDFWILKVLLATLISGIAIFILKILNLPIFIANHFILLMGMSAIGTLIFFGALIILGLSPGDREFMESIISPIREMTSGVD